MASPTLRAIVGPVVDRSMRCFIRLPWISSALAQRYGVDDLRVGQADEHRLCRFRDRRCGGFTLRALRLQFADRGGIGVEDMNGKTGFLGPCRPWASPSLQDRTKPKVSPDTSILPDIRGGRPRRGDRDVGAVDGAAVDRRR